MRGALPPHYFNSHPREGGDLFCADGFDSHADFNSRPREGGDAKLVNCTAHLSPISIHAPARGATVILFINHITAIFQFSPPRGGRQGWQNFLVCNHSHFNSRPREGGDSWRTGGKTRRPYFNSRPREGGDTGRYTPNSPTRDFNSRPREGGDALSRELRVQEYISILAPARGATFNQIFENPGH